VPVRVTALASLLVLLPAARGLPAADPPPRDKDATVVISFNVHAGFDELGGWAFDRMLTELRAAGPDVAALQEVSRGWVVNGCADLYELARESLGMHGVHGPSVLTDWGSAVFTREGIGPARTTPLPPPNLTLSRAVTTVERAIPGASPRRIHATHLHHREADPSIREAQARALVEMLSVTGDAVLLGDFNALPESEAMRILRGAGWEDAAGPPEVARFAPTYPPTDPARLLAAILPGDPSRLLRWVVAPPWGTDHGAVIARFAPVRPAVSVPAEAPAANP
jgi:endonuclease/exonuclease/phosphatase family metal-dependent hydrolase